MTTGGATCLVSAVLSAAVLGKMFESCEMRWEKQRKTNLKITLKIIIEISVNLHLLKWLILLYTS